jgi:hypothetical protein
MIPDYFPKKLFLALLTDLVFLLTTKSGPVLYLILHSDYQDFLTTVFYNAPELSFALNDWVTLVLSSNQIEDSSQSFFDIYQDTPNVKISEFVESIFLFILYLCLFALVSLVLRVRKISQSLDPYITRMYLYIVSYSCETRMQVDTITEAFFLTGLFFTMMIVTFDDDREEIIEFLNLTLFYLFLTVFFFHLTKYSIHYLSFLDSSRKGTSSVMFLVGQFLFDALNLIGFSLRFILLMARLNIYDGIDDILDSYYILFIDFDEEEYYIDSFPDFSAFFYFDTDVQDDRSFLMEDENDLTVDLYVLYTVM